MYELNLNKAFSKNFSSIFQRNDFILSVIVRFILLSTQIIFLLEGLLKASKFKYDKFSNLTNINCLKFKDFESLVLLLK